ncbi:hypothetical protein DFH06DRAFT_1133481 [Mycena polygramma]|nr:hypothetical protein DFH06DRAFT_1133481 [Mycena polygramma]
MLQGKSKNMTGAAPLLGKDGMWWGDELVYTDATEATWDGGGGASRRDARRAVVVGHEREREEVNQRGSADTSQTGMIRLPEDPERAVMAVRATLSTMSTTLTATLTAGKGLGSLFVTPAGINVFDEKKRVNVGYGPVAGVECLCRGGGKTPSGGDGVTASGGNVRGAMGINYTQSPTARLAALEKIWYRPNHPVPPDAPDTPDPRCARKYLVAPARTPRLAPLDDTRHPTSLIARTGPLRGKILGRAQRAVTDAPPPTRKLVWGGGGASLWDARSNSLRSKILPTNPCTPSIFPNYA